MQTSQKIDEIMAALYHVKKAGTKVTKTSENPFHKSKYARLEDLYKSIEPLLLEQQIVLLQPHKVIEGQNHVCTFVYHVPSGQWIESEMKLCAIKQDPQSEASSDTYFRRYDLLGVLGIAAEDDDAEKAMNRTRANSASSRPSVGLGAFGQTTTPKAPICSVCGTELKESHKKPVFYCPNFKDESRGKHDIVKKEDVGFPLFNYADKID